MFGGLDSELRAAFCSGSEPSGPQHSGARLGSQLGPDYTAMAMSLGEMVTTLSQQQPAPDQDLGKYNNMEKFLTSALCQSDTEGISDMDLLALDSGSSHRYQNGGYEGQAVDVRPYAVALYDFVPQFENELGFRKGDMVFLLQHGASPSLLSSEGWAPLHLASAAGNTGLLLLLLAPPAKEKLL